MSPHYSLIILAYNNWDFTKQCLISLLDNLEEAHIKKGIEIILVDNGSNEETKRQLQAFRHKFNQPRIQFECILLDENLGYPSGMNVGLSHCRGEIIGVLNNDLLFPPRWLGPLVDLLESERSIGFAAPFLSYAGTSMQHVGKAFETIEEMEAFAAYFTSMNKSHILYVAQIIGACMFFRRDLLAAIGGNDFWYGIGNFDDIDWCIRARLAGYRIAVLGGSFVHHIGHASFSLEADQFQTSLQINQAKFARKWRLPDDLHQLSPEHKSIQFDRNQHYIPTDLLKFNENPSPLFPRSSSALRLLICADWSHSISEWTSVLHTLLTQYADAELFIWVPSLLYDSLVIEVQIQQIIYSHTSKSAASNTLIFIQEEIPYQDILPLLFSVDEIVAVPNDYVNRSLIRLAKQAGLKINRFQSIH